MKKKLIIVAVIVFVVLGILLLCPKNNNEETVAEIRKIVEKVENESGDVVIEINYEYPEFITENEYLNKVNIATKEKANENVEGFKEFIDATKEIINSERNEILPLMYENKSSIIYNKDNIIVVQNMFYEEVAGPHPNHWIEYINYDIEKERELTINDVIPEKTDEEIASMILDKVKEKYIEQYEGIKSYFESYNINENLDKIEFAIRENGILCDLEYFVPYAFGECVVEFD